MNKAFVRNCRVIGRRIGAGTNKEIQPANFLNVQLGTGFNYPNHQRVLQYKGSRNGVGTGMMLLTRGL